MASPLRMLECLLPVVIFLLFEVNAFFLKYILWVPPRNMLNSYRLLILFLGAIPAVKVCFVYRLCVGANLRTAFLCVHLWLHHQIVPHTGVLPVYQC